MNFLDYLVFLQPIGLFLDIVGFWLVIEYGHVLFLRAGAAPVPDKLDEGTFYFQYQNGGADSDSSDYKRRRRAKAGVYLVLTGFGAQFISAVASLIPFWIV